MVAYTSVKIPMRLSEMIRESDRYKDYGYRSISEYILEAVRTRLMELRK